MAIQNQISQIKQQLVKKVDRLFDTILTDTAEFGHDAWREHTQEGYDQFDNEFRGYRPLTKQIRQAHRLQIGHVDLTFESELFGTGMFADSYRTPVNATLFGKEVLTMFADKDRYKASGNIGLGFDFVGYSPKTSEKIIDYAQKQMDRVFA